MCVNNILYLISHSIQTFTEIHSLSIEFSGGGGRKRLSILLKEMISEKYIEEENRGVFKLTELGKEFLLRVEIQDNFQEIIRLYKSKQFEYDKELERAYRENNIFRKYFQDDGQLNNDIKSKLSSFTYLYRIQNSLTLSTDKVLWIGVWRKDDASLPVGFDDDILLCELDCRPDLL